MWTHIKNIYASIQDVILLQQSKRAATDSTAFYFWHAFQVTKVGVTSPQCTWRTGGSAEIQCLEEIQCLDLCGAQYHLVLIVNISEYIETLAAM